MIARKSSRKTSAAFPKSQRRRTVRTVAVRMGAKRNLDATAMAFDTGLTRLLLSYCCRLCYPPSSSTRLLLFFGDRLELGVVDVIVRVARWELPARRRITGAELLIRAGRGSREDAHLLLERQQLHVRAGGAC